MNQGFEVLSDALTTRLLSVVKLPLSLPTVNNRAINWAVDILRHEIEMIIVNRQEESLDSERPVDLLDMLRPLKLMMVMVMVMVAYIALHQPTRKL